MVILQTIRNFPSKTRTSTDRWIETKSDTLRSVTAKFSGKRKLSKTRTLLDAIREHEVRENVRVLNCESVTLNGSFPSIDIMDDKGLKQLRNVKVLSLSTNNILQIGNLSPLTNLEILSLGRNFIHKIENVNVSRTLRELYISFNEISCLSGIESLKQLEVLSIAQNRIEFWREFVKLQQLPKLTSLHFEGNPLHISFPGTRTEWRRSVLTKLPNLRSLDGEEFNVKRIPARVSTPRILEEPKRWHEEQKKKKDKKEGKKEKKEKEINNRKPSIASSSKSPKKERDNKEKPIHT